MYNTVFGAGDFDGDGKADVLARDPAGYLWLYPGDGKGGWKSRVLVGSGWQVFNTIIGANDFNGDGTRDVLAREPSGTLWLYPGDGRGGWLPRIKIAGDWSNFDWLG